MPKDVLYLLARYTNVKVSCSMRPLFIRCHNQIWSWLAYRYSQLDRCADKFICRYLTGKIWTRTLIVNSKHYKVGHWRLFHIIMRINNCYKFPSTFCKGNTVTRQLCNFRLAPVRSEMSEKWYIPMWNRVQATSGLML